MDSCSENFGERALTSVMASFCWIGFLGFNVWVLVLFGGGNAAGFWVRSRFCPPPPVPPEKAQRAKHPESGLFWSSIGPGNVKKKHIRQCCKDLKKSHANMLWTMVWPVLPTSSRHTWQKCSKFLSKPHQCKGKDKKCKHNLNVENVLFAVSNLLSYQCVFYSC